MINRDKFKILDDDKKVTPLSLLLKKPLSEWQACAQTTVHGVPIEALLKCSTRHVVHRVRPIALSGALVALRDGRLLLGCRQRWTLHGDGAVGLLLLAVSHRHRIRGVADDGVEGTVIMLMICYYLSLLLFDLPMHPMMCRMLMRMTTHQLAVTTATPISVTDSRGMKRHKRILRAHRAAIRHRQHMLLLSNAASRCRRVRRQQLHAGQLVQQQTILMQIILRCGGRNRSSSSRHRYRRMMMGVHSAQHLWVLTGLSPLTFDSLLLERVIVLVTQLLDHIGRAERDKSEAPVTPCLLIHRQHYFDDLPELAEEHLDLIGGRILTDAAHEHLARRQRNAAVRQLLLNRWRTRHHHHRRR